MKQIMLILVLAAGMADVGRTQVISVVNDFGAGGISNGWQSDDTRRADGIHIINSTSNLPLGSATLDAPSVAAQIDWLNYQGSRGNLGGVRLDGTASGSGKSTLSLVDPTTGFGAASLLTDPGFSASYTWQNNDVVTPGLAFKIGIQSTDWGTGAGQSQNGYTPTRSGEPAWDLILVFDPADGGNTPGSTTTNGSLHVNTIGTTSGKFYLFDQAGNSFYSTPGNTGISSAKTLAEWADDPTWGSRLFGAGAKITSTQFGFGSGNSNAAGTLDSARISYLNNGLTIDFADGTKWTSAAGGDLSTSANWAGGAVPGATGNALFDLSGTYTVAVGSSTSVRSMGISNGSVTMDLATGQLLTLANGGTLFTDSGSTLTVSGPGSLSAAAVDALGTINLSTVTDLNGGSLPNPARDGSSPTATSRYGLVVQAGGTVNLLSGADVTVTQAGKNVGVRVGEGVGTGTLTIVTGANFEVGNTDAYANGLTGNGFIHVGDFGSTGVVTQTGGSASVIDGALNLGNQGGTGTWNISGGSLTLGGGLHSLGRNTGNRAAGTGTLSISGAALVEIVASPNNGPATFVVGDRDDSNTDGVGVINQTGGTVRVQNGNNLYLGGYGSSQYNLNGGTLEIGSASLQGLYGVPNTAGSYAFNLAGGTIRVMGSDLATPINATLGATTTSKVDTNGFNATLSGTLTGAGSLEKQGTGELKLTASNTYAGTTTLTAGSVEVTADQGLGTAASGTTVAAGATLKLTNVNYASSEALTLNGTGVGGNGALVNSGTSTYAGQVTAATNAKINTGGGTLNLTGGVVKDGTTVTLTGGGRVNVSGVGISGPSANSDLVIDGTTLVTTVASTYTGPTTVQNGGTLVANNPTGSATGTGTVTIDNTSTLSGTGTVNAGASNFIYLNGVMMIGDSTLGAPVASNLTLATSGSGGTVLGTGSVLHFDLFSGAGAGDNTSMAAAADYLTLFGTLDATLSSTLVLGNPNNLTGFALGDSWKLLQWATAPSIAGLLNVDYSALNLSGYGGSFDQTTGVFSVVPEPSRALLLVLGGAGLILRRRRPKFLPADGRSVADLDVTLG